MTNVESTGVASSRLRQNMEDIEGYVLQGDIIANNTSENETEVQQVTEFVSETSGNVIDIAMPPSYLMSLTDENSDLKNFLSRPYEILTQTWTHGTALDPTTHFFEPWYLYLNRTAIKNKLQNYYLFRGNLHLKVVVNASPFYYGAAMLSYAPDTRMEAAVVGAAGSTAYNVGYSQRPHINIYPQSSQGGELVVPFFWPEEWVDATSANDIKALGRCRFSSFGDLENANGASGNIDIQVFAWLEDVALSAPTSEGALQAEEIKDEYSEGPLSKPASAIARSTGMLADLPIVGNFFTAASFAAGKVAGVAKLFGYTNTPVIDDVHAFKSQPMPQVASCDIGVPSEKLTLDSKNEMTIDPRVFGVDSTDELSLNYFCGRESFIFDFPWDNTMSPGYNMASIAVHPDVKRAIAGTNQTFVHRTPMGHAYHLFKYWRGDIIYRFKIICSQYHRGRIMIAWDPKNNFGSNSGEIVFNKIVDISENTDITVTVPYMQPTAYLENYKDTNTGEYWRVPGGPIGTPGFYTNGNLCVYVNNQLTAPVTGTTIKILVYARAGPNFELAAPSDVGATNSPYSVQSEEIARYGVEDTTSLTLGNVKSITDDNINLVYHGESIKSLRTLYRRNGIYRYQIQETSYDSTALKTTYEYKMSRRPLYPGYDPNGVDNAVGLNSGVSEKYNWVRWHPMTWIDQCFVGVRGGVRWITNFKYGNSHGLITCARYFGTATTNSSNWSWVTYYSHSADAAASRGVLTASLANIAGSTISNSQVMPCLDVIVPMYSRYKFLEATPTKRVTGLSAVGSGLDAVTLSLSTNEIIDKDQKVLDTQFGVSAAPDYTPVFFLNVPTMFVYDSEPVPP